MPSTASSVFAARMCSSRSSLGTSRSSNRKPLEEEEGVSQAVFLGPSFRGRTHFCLHVFCVQFAYIRAAGSPFAKKPTSSGGRSIFAKLALTSFSRPSATVAAETTLQVAGGGSSLAMDVGTFSAMFVEGVVGRGWISRVVVVVGEVGCVVEGQRFWWWGSCLARCLQTGPGGRGIAVPCVQRVPGCVYGVLSTTGHGGRPE